MEHEKSRTVNPQISTIGFGCPETTDPHRFEVDIPPGRTGAVSIVECYGIKAGIGGRGREAGIQRTIAREEARRQPLDRGREQGRASARQGIACARLGRRRGLAGNGAERYS